MIGLSTGRWLWGGELKEEGERKEEQGLSLLKLRRTSRGGKQWAVGSQAVSWCVLTVTWRQRGRVAPDRSEPALQKRFK